jgi:type VI secretion system secreted protein VgrG
MSTLNRITLRLAGDDAPELDVRRFSVREQLSTLWSIEAVVTAGDDRFTFDKFIDRGAAFSLSRPSGETPLRLWTGVCAGITHLAARDGGLSTYSVTVVPEFWRLTLNRNSRVFQHRSIPQIVLAILSEWQIEVGQNLLVRYFDAADDERYPKLEMRVQYEESDFNFIARLLEEAGVSFYFEYVNSTTGGGKARELTWLVLDGEPNQASADENAAKDGKKALVGPLRYEGAEHAASFDHPDDFVVNASARRIVRPGAVALFDHDFRQALGLHVKENGKIKTQELVYEQFAYTPGMLQRERDPQVGDEGVVLKNAPHAANELLTHRLYSCVMQFQTNATQVVPGTVLGLDTEVHTREELYQHPLIVVATEIVGDPTGAWAVNCAAVTATLPYRPPKTTPKPRIFGLQSALVVGATTSSEDDEQIECDEHGRVRIQFHWDRVHQYGTPLPGGAKGGDGDRLGSCWVRFTTPWAGSNYGFVAIPRVGHEVLVSFLDGDPDRPVIVSSLHNGTNPSPYAPNAQPGPSGGGPMGWTVSGLRSCTTPDGDGFNELAFDDRKGAERIHMQAQKDLSTIVKNAETLDVGAGRATNIGATDTLLVENQWTLLAGDRETGIWIDKDKRIRAQVNGANGATVELSDTGIYFNAKSDIHFHAGANIHFSAINEVNMDSDHAAGKLVDINPPGREPDDVSLPDYTKAKAPAPGAKIPPTKKPTLRGEQPPQPVGAIMKDVEFAKKQEDEDEEDEQYEDERDEVDGSSALSGVAASHLIDQKSLEKVDAGLRATGQASAGEPVTRMGNGILVKGDKDFTQAIRERLTTIGSTSRGQQLLKGFGATGKEVLIIPENGDAGAAPFDLLNAYAKGQPVRNTAGEILKIQGKELIGLGGGSDSLIGIDPNLTLKSPDPNKPYPPDAALFHELEHSLVAAKGEYVALPDKQFDNSEEARAIAAENDYLMERGYDFHREDHGVYLVPNQKPAD